MSRDALADLLAGLLMAAILLIPVIAAANTYPH